MARTAPIFTKASTAPALKKGNKRQRSPDPEPESSEAEGPEEDDEAGSDEEADSEDESEPEPEPQPAPAKRRRVKTQKAVAAEAALAKAKAGKKVKTTSKKKQTATPLQVAYTADGELVSYVHPMVNLPFTQIQDLGHDAAIANVAAVAQVADDLDLFFGPKGEHVFTEGAKPLVGRFCLTCR